MKKIIFNLWNLLFGVLFITFSFFGCASTKSENFSSVLLEQNPAIVSGKLDNGMSYYIQENHDPKNRILLRLVIAAGSNMEEDDQLGVAHFVEHMAFNGSKHFAQNQLVDYFESIGMVFGPEVNAYTSFDETVYMLELPADNVEALETGLVVLKDWADGLTFDQEELDKERGVVIEEWRLGRGLSGRLLDAQTPFLLKDSRYAKRIPIGDMEIIENIPRQRVVDFYEKWYRPELMSIVIVGAADAKYLEQAVIRVMSDIPASEETLTSPNFSIPKQKEEAVLIFRDKEQPYSLIQILEQVDYNPVKTEAQFRDNVINSIVLSILNTRLSDISQSENAPWVDSIANSVSLSKNSTFNMVGFVPQSGNFQKGLSTLLNEVLRYKKFGAVQEELSREKEFLEKQVEQIYLTRTNIPSSQIASQLINHALTGAVVLSPQEIYNLYNKILPTISLKDINKAAKNIFTNTGFLMLVQAPLNATDIPSEKELLHQWKNYKPSEELKPYIDTTENKPWQIIPEESGSAKFIESDPNTNIETYQLSNGATLYLLKTNFKPNEIIFDCVSPGGVSLVADKDVPSALFATDYVAASGLNNLSATDLQKKLAGKNVNINTYIGDYSEGLSGNAASRDLETLMQLIHLKFVAPNFADTAWDNLMSQIELISESRNTSPQNVFVDELRKVLFGDEIRKAAITPEFASMLDKNTAKKIYTEKFSNPRDFSFIFVGDFVKEELLELAERYLATIPDSSNQKEIPVDKEPDFPSSKKIVKVQRGMEEQSQVFLAFGGELPEVSPTQNIYENQMLSILKQLLEIRLRESIREDMGGSYNISVFVEMILTPKRGYMIQIFFGCQPGREQELTDAIFSEINTLQQNLLDDSYMTKLKESYRREQEINLKTNIFWASAISTSVLTGIPIESIVAQENILDSISPQTMRQLATKYLNTDNYVLGFLTPESL